MATTRAGSAKSVTFPVAVATPAHKVLRFGRFTLDPNTASLCIGDRQLQLRPKAFDVLRYLADHPGRIVSKDELIEAVWPNLFVTDNSLVQCISDIRGALDDEAQAVLKTVARRGYLLMGPVVEVESTPQGVENGHPADAEGPVHATPGHVPIAAAIRRGLPLQRRPAALLAVGALVIVAAVAAVTWRQATPGPEAVVSRSDGRVLESATSQKRISVAVLPLVTLGVGAADDYFADGLTEDIIAALSRFTELSVISPKAVLPYKGKAVGAENIGRELKVRYIAEGSLRQSPERIRIAMRLTDASLGTLLWADQYDAEPNSIFAIQDNITRQITGALAVRLNNVEQARVAAKPPSSLEAYDLVLRGRDLLTRLNRSATSNARVMFERAAELDPNYAAAYVGLGRVDLTAVALGWTPDPAGALRRAEGLARKAIGIDEFSPAAHVLLGRSYARLGEYDRAIEALRRALALNPSDPDSYAGLGDALLWSGDLDGAIKALETAVQLDPRLSTEDLFNLGAAYFLAGQDTEAVRTFERTVARNDSNAFIHAMLAAVYAGAGRKDESDREIAEVRRRSPFFDAASFGSLFRNPEHRQKIVAALQKAGF
jgi:TolB-like protein/DNA-binding winged helix-turn-helix (wHTH) protein/cytochrome c-type biogenesis protein CcmH/NrfG